MSSTTDRDYVLQVMTFALRVGEEMLESAVACSEVEAELRRLTDAFGLHRCEVSVTLNVITLCHLTAAEPGPFTLIRVVESSEPRLDRLAALEGLIRRVEAGELSIVDATDEIDQLDSAAPPYRPVTSVLAGILSISAWVVFAGGGLWGAITGLLAGLVMEGIVRIAPERRVPTVFVTATCAAVAAAVPTAAAALDVPIALAPAVAGGLFALLPGGLLVASVTDGLGGSPVSALAKGLEAALAATAVAFGALASLTVAERFGVTSSVVATSAPFAVALAAGVVAVGALAVFRSLPPRFVPATTLVAATAFAVSHFDLRGPAGVPVSTLIGAIVIGLGGQLAGRFFGTTAALHTTTSVYVLVPGFTAYLAMHAFAQGATSRGVDHLVTALGIAVAIAAGIALGAAAGRTLPSPRARVKVWRVAAKRTAVRPARRA